MLQNDKKIKMIILDLDGVITSTAALHAQAWKEMFDSFLQTYSSRTNTIFIPLDIQNDYRLYIDGRPRYEGAQKFLRSRNIEIPYGHPTDEPDKETVCGLGNHKNKLYLLLLHEKGAQVFPDTLMMIKTWRSRNIKVGVISASKNCREVLSSVHITDLFDVIVDGTDSEKYHLRGKPEPDIFLFAAQKMGVDPAHTTIVEDSSAGIKAGTDARFAHRIGVARAGNSELLYSHGADIVVSDLTRVPDFNDPEPRPFGDIARAFDHFDSIFTQILQFNPFFLFDYDGTLTPIVPKPELAILSSAMREVIRKLSLKAMVAIVSGRDLADVKRLVDLDNLYYAGSHGIQIAGPGNLTMEPQEAQSFIPAFDDAEKFLRRELANIKGLLVERKKYAITVHYRLVAPELDKDILEVMKMTHLKTDNLILKKSKKGFELRPALDWDKGKAIRWLAGKLFQDQSTSPLYIGDDLTDEDAFRELDEWGIGILIGDHGEKSFADYTLDDTTQVYNFLKKIETALTSQ
jgi:alpha,alpha-trehalase